MKWLRRNHNICAYQYAHYPESVRAEDCGCGDPHGVSIVDAEDHTIAENLRAADAYWIVDTLNQRELQCHRLASIVAGWEKEASKYFDLSEQETDPLGQKFYQSSAMAYTNCAEALRRFLDSDPT